MGLDPPAADNLLNMPILADNPVSILSSLLILGVLILLLCASCWVFAVLLKMWTTHRPIAALRQWARPRGYGVLGRSQAAVPAMLQTADPPLQAILELRTLRLSKQISRATSFIQLQTASAPSPSASTPQRWHVMIMAMESDWPLSGLRPAQLPVSLLDLLRLRTSPSLVESLRFSVMGQEIAAARKLSATGIRSLLPADIGLLLGPGALLLDFSTRPFDDIEFERMLIIGEQVIAALAN